MSDKYKIKIMLDDDTLRKLYQTEQSLRVYKGVRGTVAGGFCTVWFSINTFAGTVNLEWKPQQYGGYVCHGQLEPGINIDASCAENLEPGNLMTVQDDGTLMLTSDNSSGISIRNNGIAERICGISELFQDKMPSICAFPLFGRDLRDLKPLEKVLLEFDYGMLPSGTVVEKAWLKSIVIDFAKAKEKQLVVSYDISTGWNAQNAVWAKISNDPIEIAEVLNEPVIR